MKLENSLLQRVKVELDYPDSDMKQQLLQTLEDSDSYQVTYGGEQTVNGDVVDELSFVRPNDMEKWQGRLGRSKFKYFFRIDSAEDGFASLRSTVGEELFDELSKTVYKYRRPLSVDEGNVSRFVDKMVSRLEDLGYDVTHERDYGNWISVDKETNETEKTKEYKWWIYVMNQDGSLAEHGLELYFTEEGIFMYGHVTEGVENEEEFRKVLTEFSIED